jgi:hypothetical protein
LTIVAARNYVIDGARILDAQWACHAHRSITNPAAVQVDSFIQA